MEIKVTGLTKAFGDKNVLNGLSFSVPIGSVVRITGSSGIGKTTLLRILCGLEKATSGEIFGIHRKDISYLFQEDRLFDTLSAIENVTLVMKGDEKKDRAKKLLSDLGLTNKDFNCRPSELSGGMCRRVAIARALAYDKPILFLDEALRGLDEENAVRTARVIERESVGKTIFFVTHGDVRTMLEYKTVDITSAEI